MKKPCSDKAIRSVLEVSRAVSSSLDPEKVARIVLKELRRVLEVDHVALFLVGEGSKRPMLTDAVGFSYDQMHNIDILSGWEAVNELLIKKRKAVLVNNIGSAKGPGSAFLNREKFPLRAFLAVPLMKEKKVIGTLISSTGRRSARLFTDSDAGFLETLSNHISIAISNANLFAELSSLQAEAAQKEKMAVLGTLASSINHEIRNPLSLARTRCDAFLLDMKEGLYRSWSADKTMEQVRVVMSDTISYVDRAITIAQDLSDFAKPSKGVCEPVDVSVEIDAVLKLVGHEFNLSGIEVRKEIDYDARRILADRKQIQEILFNLLRNAAQAIENKGTIIISTARRKKKILIDIKDTGSGISKDKIQDLFKPFFTTKEQGHGTGVGLFIVRKIVERSGGEIYLKSTKPGKGTTFSLEFPECA